MKTDYRLKYIIFRHGDEEYTLSFRESFFKGIYDISCHRKQITVLCQYPGLRDRLRHRAMEMRLGLKDLNAKKRKHRTADESPAVIKYEVKPRDTLCSISKTFFGSYDHADEIAELNGIPSLCVLLPGQILLIPKKN